MIPASAEYGVPGADDETIFADIVKSLGRDRDDVRRALGALATLAGGAVRRPGRRRGGEVAAATFRADGGAGAGGARARRSCTATTATTA